MVDRKGIVSCAVGVALAMVAAPVRAQPANDDCAAATVVTSLPFTETVDTSLATTEVGEPTPSCLFSGSGQTIWYAWTNGSSEDVRLSIDVFDPEDPLTDPFAAAIAFDGPCGALVEVGDCGGDQERAAVMVAPGQTIRIRIDGSNHGEPVRVTLAESTELVVALDKYDVELDRASVAMNGAGRFLVVWNAFPDGDTARGRLYESDGTPIGTPFEFTSNGFSSEVAASTTGDFLVAWSQAGNVVGQRVANDGSLLGIPFAVNAYTTGAQGDPAIAPTPGGGFVVVWGGAGPGDSSGIFGRRLDASGNGIGGDFQVNVNTVGYDYDPRVATDGSGAFVVVWSAGYDARLFDPTGTPLGGEFDIGDALDGKGGGINNMDVARAPGGEFMVAWNGYRDEPGFEECSMFGQTFDAAGAPSTSTFCVHEIRDYEYNHHRVSASANDEGFVVAWEDDGGRTGYDEQIDMRARRFAADGAPLAGDFEVTLLNRGSQYQPDVSAGPSGGFVVVWNDPSGNTHGPDDALLARVFPPPALACAASMLAGCRTPTTPLTSKLLILDDADDTADQLRWKFVKGAATDITAFGDPTVDEDYVLCMYDGAGTTLLMENRMSAGGTCASKPCWKALGDPPSSKGYRLKDPERTPHGILKMVLKPGEDGKAKVVVKGGQDRVFQGGPGAPSLPLVLPVTVQLQNSSGECWQATFDTEGVGESGPGLFKGSGS